MTAETTTRPVACRRCGGCCADVGTPPFMPDEKPLVPPTVRDTMAAFMASDPDRCESGKPCYFWDEVTHDCRIYAYRPAICRDFVPGGDGCSQHPAGRPGHARTDNQAAAEMAAGAIDHV